MDLYEIVLKRADGRCECKGECGQSHKQTEARCLHRDGQKHRLSLIPKAEVNPRAACLLGSNSLLALCPDCANRTASKRRTAKAKQNLDRLTDAQITLF